MRYSIGSILVLIYLLVIVANCFEQFYTSRSKNLLADFLQSKNVYYELDDKYRVRVLDVDKRLTKTASKCLCWEEHMEEVHLGYCDDFRFLAQQKNLKILDISESNFSDNEVKFLLNKQHLKSVNLSRRVNGPVMPLTLKGLKQLLENPSIKRIYVEDGQFDLTKLNAESKSRIQVIVPFF